MRCSWTVKIINTGVSYAYETVLVTSACVNASSAKYNVKNSAGVNKTILSYFPISAVVPLLQ